MDAENGGDGGGDVGGGEVGVFFILPRFLALLALAVRGIRAALRR